MYYTMCPTLFLSRSFCATEDFEQELPYMRFRSLKDAVAISKRSGVCYREQNWKVFEHRWFGRTRISLATLKEMGLIAEILPDCH